MKSTHDTINEDWYWRTKNLAMIAFWSPDETPQRITKACRLHSIMLARMYKFSDRLIAARRHVGNYTVGGIVSVGEIGKEVITKKSAPFDTDSSN